jgi:C4-dicarboxylate-specific signal transduction histidine kinase
VIGQESEWNDETTGRPRVILVVDDEPVNRELLEVILAPQGHAILHAEDGLQALELLAGQRVDLVLLDLLMPRLDGIETCRRIREHPETQHLPVVFITALQDRDARIRGKAVGADDFLSKPVDDVELLVRVKNLLKVRAYHELRERQRALLEEKLDRMRTQVMRVERLAMLGTLAAGVGHELANMATVFEGTLGVMAHAARDGLPPEQADLDSLAGVAAHLRLHIRQLGMVSPADPERAKPIDLRQVVQGTLRMLRTAGRTKRIEVNCQLPDAPVMVPVSRPRIEQVLVNLVANAADALEEVCGRAKVIKLSLATDRAAGRVHCHVEDSGCGIPQRDLPSIFKPYFTTKPPDRGTGLGLSVVKTIVEAYGGRLQVQSREGEGSLFTFDLPALTEEIRNVA